VRRSCSSSCRTRASRVEATVGYGLLIAGAIGGFITALVIIFIPKVAPFTAPLYAALEGLVLGAISAVFEAMYPGIVIQAVGLSIGVLAVMLFVYGTGIIRATEKFKIGVVAATGAIFLVYLVDIVLALFGIRLPFIHESGLVERRVVKPQPVVCVALSSVRPAAGSSSGTAWAAAS
jgi:uncharacterized YccA/Bax inhibitor family protein